ncbi:MAG: hypothetical protein AAFO99_03400 [Bacteroidota bacterium]
MKKIVFVLAMVFAAWSCSDDDDFVDPTDDAPNPPAQGEISVVLNEVAYLSGEVELLNDGDENIDVSNYFLCLGPGTYRRIGDLEVQGNLNLEPGQFLVIDYGMPNADGGLGLYIDNSGFADPNTLADFVQWGAAGSVREEVAVAAGIWTVGEFVPVLGDEDNSIVFDGLGNSASDWEETTSSTLGAANIVTPPSGNASVVLNEVGYLNDQIELYNNGNVNVDVSDYFLCLGPATYRRVGDLVVSGNLDLAPGEFLVLNYEMPNAEGGLGLYLNNTGFGDPTTIADFVQWGASGSVREEVAVAAGIWTLGEFVNVIGNSSTSIIYDGTGDSASDWSETSETTFGTANSLVAPEVSISLNEVEYLGDRVELYNSGNVTIDISDYFLCLGPGTYRRLGDLNVEGDLLLTPGSFLTATYDQINTASGQINGTNATGGLGLYINSTGFADPTTLADFVQWGASGSIREEVAVAAGIWPEGEFVNVVSDVDNSIAFDGEGNTAADWSETTTLTFGAANTITPPVDVTSVIINEVEYLVNDEIELYNNGNQTVDLTDYWMCFGPGQYFRIGDAAMTTIISGSLNLAPGEFLVVSPAVLSAPDAAGGLGLYINGIGFGDSNNIRSFVQWGASGNARESVAVEAGIWNAGGFVPNVTSGQSIAYDGEGNASTDWNGDETPSLGSGN